MRYFSTFSDAIREARRSLQTYGNWVDPGRWQGVPTEGKPDLQTRELLSFAMSVPMPQYKPEECEMEQPLFMLRDEIQPNLPWADLEFDDRVGRIPLNPHHSLTQWPWWRGQVGETMAGGKFTHTYSERFWPKRAGRFEHAGYDYEGTRYKAGDLDDLIRLLYREPYTRQAYLPIFFPEDTGAVHEGRIPCTLGYQFMLRDLKLHMWYFIRSCDYVRHFRDDIYLAARLQLWVLSALQEWELRADILPAMQAEQLWVDVDPGYFNMMICSLHYHRGDQHHVWTEKPVGIRENQRG